MEHEKPPVDEGYNPLPFEYARQWNKDHSLHADITSEYFDFVTYCQGYLQESDAQERAELLGWVHDAAVTEFLTYEKYMQKKFPASWRLVLRESKPSAVVALDQNIGRLNALREKILAGDEAAIKEVVEVGVALEKIRVGPNE